ncbi:hypothetical protein LWI29_007857 [Acer saccharum]|uniref:Uncharacterized protein n=1 Tax=Acer saccharum TaxID=4024 RepID=A0AA39TIZ8_ACESA|nr:hypothetical protein LWI29_007857 [Acer saccharum]
MCESETLREGILGARIDCLYVDVEDAPTLRGFLSTRSNISTSTSYSDSDKEMTLTTLKFRRFVKLEKKKVNSRRNEFKVKTLFKKYEEVSSHVKEHMPNFTAFGASYVEDEDDGKNALIIDSIYECRKLLLNVLKKNEKLSKENESLKMWKISSVEKIRTLEEGKQICEVELHQSKEMMSEQLEENTILISLMKIMEMKSSMDDSLKTDIIDVSKCCDSLKDLLDVTIEYKKVVERNEARSRSRSTVVESRVAELERDVYRLKNTKSTSLVDRLRRQEGCTLFKNRPSGSRH